jgi:hypothetical protein
MAVSLKRSSEEKNRERKLDFFSGGQWWGENTMTRGIRGCFYGRRLD